MLFFEIMEPRLEQRQSQQLALSPQLRQFLKLLQLPITDLRQEINMELENNPLLEESAAPATESDTQEDGPETASKNAEELSLGESFEHLADYQENLDGYYDSNEAGISEPGEAQEKKSFQESLITKPEALWDFLFWQLRFLDLDDKQKKVGQQIIDNIDESGYLTGTLEDIAFASAITVEEAESVLSKIQRFDPPGIACRNLQEALLLQLYRKGPDAFLARTIVRDHLALLEKREWNALARILSVDLGVVKKTAQMIARLETKPGRIFYSDESEAIAPDAAIYFADEVSGKLKIDIFDEQLPSLRINGYYRRILRDKSTDPETRKYIRDKMKAAMEFMRSLSLRKSTLRQITEQIVEAQREFFEKGFSHLRPLRLKDIAKELEIHESTVSRAISGKYVQTPQGLIPYKSFFSTKMTTREGTDESQKSIMEAIRKLIQQEIPDKPLSDQGIVKRLGQDGILIARRTVAKYRDLLKILPSHLRKNK